jgi:VanZ family protein
MSGEDGVAGTSNRQGIGSRIRRKIVWANWAVIGPKLLGTVCVFLLVGLLVAGLWPFHSPKNQVTWVVGGYGMHFGRHGTILSSGKFKAMNAPENAPCSLEIWLEPDFIKGTTLLTFYAPESLRQLSLHQSLTDLALQTDIREGRYRSRTARLYVGDVFQKGKRVFVTVTSGGGQTSVYVDGILARTAPNFPLSSQDLDGELVVANLPVIDNSWSGGLWGLAFYRQDLTPVQVHRHFATWTSKGRPEVFEDERAVALYLFNEGSGRVIHNQVSSGTDLYIPDRYKVLDQAFLRPFWDEFYPSWSYLEDVLINIGGFVPFGFILCAYFSLTGRFKRPALVTILLGFTVSLTIEVLQAYLPTRDSGTTDLITNTLGTCCGVWLYRLKLWRALFAKIWAGFVGTAEKGQVEPNRVDPIPPRW